MRAAAGPRSCLQRARRRRRLPASACGRCVAALHLGERGLRDTEGVSGAEQPLPTGRHSEVCFLLGGWLTLTEVGMMQAMGRRRTAPRSSLRGTVVSASWAVDRTVLRGRWSYRSHFRAMRSPGAERSGHLRKVTQPVGAEQKRSSGSRAPRSERPASKGQHTGGVSGPAGQGRRTAAARAPAATPEVTLRPSSGAISPLRPLAWPDRPTGPPFQLRLAGRINTLPFSLSHSLPPTHPSTPGISRLP